MVNPTAAATELDAVHHEVVVVGYRELGFGSEDVDVFGAAWRGEGVVSGGQNLAGVIGWRNGGKEGELGDPEGGETTDREAEEGFDTGIVEGEAQVTQRRRAASQSGAGASLEDENVTGLRGELGRNGIGGFKAKGL